MSLSQKARFGVNGSSPGTSRNPLVRRARAGEIGRSGRDLPRALPARSSLATEPADPTTNAHVRARPEPASRCRRETAPMATLPLPPSRSAFGLNPNKPAAACPRGLHAPIAGRAPPAVTPWNTPGWLACGVGSAVISKTSRTAPRIEASRDRRTMRRTGRGGAAAPPLG